MDLIPKLPVAEWIDAATKWTTNTFGFLFDFIKNDFGDFIEIVAEDWLMAIPIWLFIVIVGVLAFIASGKRLGLTAFSVIGLWFISNQELWEELMNTFTLVIFASLISVIIGVPFGIWMAKSRTVEKILTPVLDFMQTMPAFVYLIPAVAFFSIGMVPGVFASVIFATPPTVRFTNLGIRQVSHELIEASDSFGTTGTQKLFKVQLPMAKKTIMAGINQTVMLALSMVVIASMIGAKGLGQTVITGLQRAEVGTGFVAGLGIVILAIIIDRFTQNLNTQRGEQ
ncbi:glycine betaine/proline transport system permease protein/glycine betaine/proline transport system substrate-binding protein [Halobacillus karajensis]|uniref:Glycine betaine/carnitine transport permease protein GbuB n=1 Tax=Halobacillus karajensis TaxID=195088 RepID=A0A059NZK7_9BACI|nr:proline/glycine betaine ABC transporter permease [Halobacillus karajensis]CDQ21109.1 Glycine betaine/carnitine transport permease protein GbuB [Halobacillus karajensis]CDQ24827.1 Glycine betaine/carnitine transport permease protein GbuB [Halobacillus karajensis]CDQ28813.1 Glycine betaine/carnitine transport permease protein GbuB [Halobacillus karajensis]SEH96113.1 glycine betaine/proline transport system permease protein/glycine betaine/proline transport system substrate-binding protein [Hal